MIAEKTNLNGVYLIKNTAFEDFRGSYLQTYNENEYKNAIDELRDVKFVEDDLSETYRNCLKGIHGNYSAYKLISCLHGKFYLVVIDYNPTSDQFGKWQSFVLSDSNRCQVLVPPGFGNGHLCVSEKSLFYYKQSGYYDISDQFTIRYNDERFNIFWPIKDPIVSLRDLTGDKSYVKS